MISWRRTNQGGALQIFIIIAVLLALATIVTINFVHDRGEQARRSQAIAQANDQSAADKAVSSPGEGAAKDSDKSGAATEAGAGEVTHVTAPEAGVLPITGPGDLAVSFVTVGLLAGFGAAYIMSRRDLKRSL